VGEYDDYDFDAYSITRSNGEVIQIRNGPGRPPWAGGPPTRWRQEKSTERCCIRNASRSPPNCFWLWNQYQFLESSRSSARRKHHGNCRKNNRQ
jgi:hypothetical protein